MQTIAGGIVKYVGVQLLPCPEQPRFVGQVVAAARLDMSWNGRVVERIALDIGDALMVADGAQVAAGAEVCERTPHRHTLRAAIPDGVEAVVRWRVPPIDAVDPITGLTELRFADKRDATVQLCVDGVVAATTTLPDGRPFVRDGAVVRRGDRLAELNIFRGERAFNSDLDIARALLEVEPVSRQPLAVVAPCDATVTAIEPTWIDVQTDDGRALRLRRSPRAHAAVEIGDRVSAGAALTYGERHHRALLHAWGAPRLGDHLLDELAETFGDAVPRVYLALAVRAMLQRGQLRGIATIARERRALTSDRTRLRGSPAARPRPPRRPPEC